MAALTVAQVNDWHVYVDGEWLTISYDGYAPVTVEINGHLRSVSYPHMAYGCARSVCTGVHADSHAQYGAARH